MRIRHLLLSSVVCSSVVMMSSASWAQTAPKVVYKPQGEWAVTRMAAKGPGKTPYCTMARRFGENTILTFARNAKDETSLAMDFQPNTLAKGQSYYVTLDAGSNEKRAFDVIPVSDKAMVIRLGQDAIFHDALNQSGVLSVDVAGLQFEFNVPDMAKGHQDLGGCVTSIVEPAAGESSAPVEMVQVAPQDNTVARRATDDILSAPITSNVTNNVAGAPVPLVHQEISEAEALREENMRLKNALERERREYEDRAMRENAGSSQVSEVMEKLKLLEKENGDLKYQLADARSVVPKVVSAPVAEPVVCVPTTISEIDPAQAAEISMLREENAQLKSDISIQKAAMAQLEMKVGQITDGAQSADTATITRLQSRVDELIAQNSKLQSDVMSAQASASAAAAVAPDSSISLSQLRAVESQLKSVETERDSLRAQITKMGEGQEGALLKLSGSDWNLEQATRRFNEAEREIRRLGGQLEQARTQCTAEKKEIEYMLFDPEIATQEQISKLMALETEMNAAKAELARRDTEVSGKIGSYEDQIAKLQAELDASKGGPVETAGFVQNMVASIQPAAGTPRVDTSVGVTEREISRAVARAIEAEPIAAPASNTLRSAGYVSPREYGHAAIALAPKSAIASDAFVPTNTAVAPQTSALATSLVTADALSAQLRQAGLALSGDVKKVENVSGPGFVAYSWDASGLFGTAEQKPMGNPEQFLTMVNQYLDKTKSRCAGDFAASPVPTEVMPGVQVASYEIACISQDGTGATAALVFYGKDGLFTTVAHESGMDTMDMAMDARDRVIAGLSSGKATN